MGAALEEREPPRAFRHARGDVNTRVKIARFLPKELRLVGFAGVERKNREAANGIRQIQRRGSLVAAIDFQRFAVTRLGKVSASLVPLNVADVSNGVRYLKRVALRAVDS